MNQEQFDSILEGVISREYTTLTKKSVHYESHDDKLRNFKVAACLGNTTPEQALKFMMIKHITSLFIYIDETERGITIPVEKWQESISDTRNYLFLLECLITERAAQAASVKETKDGSGANESKGKAGRK